jgi:hypothetical protein
MKNFIYYFFLIFIISCSKDKNEISGFDIKFNILGKGSVDLQSGFFLAGQKFTVNAIPDQGYYFDYWEGDIVGEDNPLELSIQTNLNLVAVFTIYPQLSTEITKYEPKEIDQNPIFIIENGGNVAYLVSKTGERINTWNFNLQLGNDIELLSDGSVIGIFKPEKTFFSFGGYGGVLRKYNFAGDLTWEYEINSEKELMHHDFTILPNGNILVLVWERILLEDVLANGVNSDSDLFTEKIVEINPLNNEVLWQWRSWDHSIQDQNENAFNFGNISEQFKKIDLNYSTNKNGDIMHANGIEYNSERDLIFLSVNFYSEVWVIDHSISSEDSSTSLGDLKYRFGNPSAYKAQGERLFYNNHHPNFIKLDPLSTDNFLIYMNGSKDKQSIVYEFSIPNNYLQNTNSFIEPEIQWSFTDSELFHGKISGAIRLSNGNTLICEGDYGYWEVTKEGKIVWLFDGGGTTFWRGYSVSKEVANLFL